MKNKIFSFYGINRQEGILFTIFVAWLAVSEDPYTFQVKYKNFDKQGYRKIYEGTIEGDKYYLKEFVIGPFSFATTVIDNNE